MCTGLAGRAAPAPKNINQLRLRDDSFLLRKLKSSWVVNYPVNKHQNLSRERE